MTAPLPCLEEAKVDSPGQRPGSPRQDAPALKGRDKSRPVGADSGIGIKPRALPWAIKLQAVGLGIRRLAAIFFILLLNVFLFGSQAGKEYNEADAALNATYQKVLAKMKDPQSRALLIASERAWVQYRDACVQFDARYYPESKGGLFLNTDLTRE